MELIQHKNKWYIKSDTGYNEVLATTDKSLFYKWDTINGIKTKSLPQPSQQFIEAFVKESGIDKVLVELTYGICTHNSCYKDDCKDICTTIKTNSHNEITIHPIKPKVYSKEEVETLCRRVIQQFASMNSYDEDNLNAWLIKNL